MFNGVHVMIYDQQADALRAFFRDVLEMPAIDAGEGWLILKLPPAELGVHPSDAEGATDVYLMCDDAEATTAKLEAKGVKVTERADRGWGVVFSIEGPGGRLIHCYEPRHPTAHSL